MTSAPPNDAISSDIACLDKKKLPATLISTRGFHCHVWQASQPPTETRDRLEVIIKKAHGPVSWCEVKALQREFARIKAALGPIVPETYYVHTRVDGQPGVIVLAEVIKPWFDLANPGNEEESLNLLRLWPEAATQFKRFVEAATDWAGDDLLIDLTGDTNLVLDRDRSVRFIDSFRVFFYVDMLHVIDDVDMELRGRIDLCKRRLAYLQRLAARV